MPMNDKYVLPAFIAIFAFFYFLPQDVYFFSGWASGGINLLGSYAKEHVLTCLVPALFIAGAISSLLKKDFVLKYLGDKTNKLVSHGVGSVSGIILAVCSCTVLPLFAGIWKRGAGLGPAITFLYSGPAINVAAIFLTASVLGYELGMARAVAAIMLSIFIGIAMGFVFRDSEKTAKGPLAEEAQPDVPLGTVLVFILIQILFLVIAGISMDFGMKLLLFAAVAAFVSYMAYFIIPLHLTRQWLAETWDFSRTILPLLFAGVFVAGIAGEFLPDHLVNEILGGNGIESNLAASVFGAFMYFATLTEVPIIQMLLEKGMGSGPALALLLAGPSLSLPSMLVIFRVLGLKKTAVYIALVIVASASAGMAFGLLVQ